MTYSRWEHFRNWSRLRRARHPELAAHERHVVVVLILIDQLVSPLFVSRLKFIWRNVLDF